MSFRTPQFQASLATLQEVNTGQTVLATFEQLGAAFYPNMPAQAKQRVHGGVPGLKKAVESMFTRDLHAGRRARGAPATRFDFFGIVLPAIIKSAASIPTQFPTGGLPHLTSGVKGQIVVTRQQAHALLSCGFLGIMPKLTENFGELDYTGLMFSSNPIAIERIICQLIYFDYVETQFGGCHQFPPQSGSLIFERVCTQGEDIPNWAECPAVLVSGISNNVKKNDASVTIMAPGETSGGNGDDLSVVVDDLTTIEDAPGAQAQVDFANKQLMLGILIPSMTQEEVMFSIRPEMFLSLPFFDTLGPNEAVIAYGAKRYADYSGYLQTFQVTAVHYDATHDSNQHLARYEPCIIAIDAIVNRGDQFEGPMVRRDLNKAYTGYHSAPKGCRISTGNWGCGAFMGDPVLKYLQQVMALAASNYCVNHQPDNHRRSTPPLRSNDQREGGAVVAGGGAGEDPTTTASPRTLRVGSSTGLDDKTFTYCTFRKPALALDLEKLTKSLAVHQITVAQAYYWLNEYEELLECNGGAAPLDKFFLQKISGLVVS